ncbi:MAG: glutamate--tRNA ligase [Candidatus Nanoarchaeia archaeon]|nr:glutamate--tRNA ligase [Candidatus Nanoarchaeia archaeon]
MLDSIRKYVLENAVKHDGKAVLGAIIGKLINEDPSIKNKLKEINKDIQKVINDVNKLSLEKQTEELNKIAPELLEKKEKQEFKLKELPNVSKNMVMRIAPFPSGPLHIGNARIAILNDEYCKKYKGKLILVIDDTIGSEEKQIAKEAYKLIPEGLDFLDVNYDKEIIYKSDRLDIYYKYAEELIKKDKAYVCSCSSEQIRENRQKGLECKCRSQSIEETLKKWKLMFDKKTKEGSFVLRIKTSMQDKNPAFRDRVLFRISEREHPKVGTKYKVWPLLEFSWAIDDHLLKVTHVIRGNDLMIESDMEKYIWDIFGWEHAVLLHCGLLQLEGVKISKSKAQKEVKSGEYSGWDDPRTWSLQSLKRRGIKPEAIRNFLLQFGLNQNEVMAPIDGLYSENKKLIEKDADRYFFIDNAKKIKIKNIPKTIKIAKAPLHPDYPKRGFRKLEINDEFYISDDLEKNKVYRFMHLFNFKNNEFLSLNYDQKLEAKMIHWLPVSKDLVNVEVLMVDGTILKGFGEVDLKNVKEKTIVQFERRFFAILDKKDKNKLQFWYTHS